MTYEIRNIVLRKQEFEQTRDMKVINYHINGSNYRDTTKRSSLETNFKDQQHSTPPFGSNRV